MGSVIDPAHLTESGELCIHRLTELGELRLPPAQLITAIGTAVEVHVSRVLARLIVLSGIQDHELGNAMLVRLEQDMNKSWPSRGAWLRNGFSVEYMGDKPYQDFDVLVELRNAVVHGDGAASDQQERKGVAALRNLRRSFADRLDVEFHGRAKFGSTSATLAMDIARRFVADFDRSVLVLYPDAGRL